MPAKKHKRKASDHTRSKRSSLKQIKPAGLIASNPRLFICIGISLIALGMYLLAFESQYDAMFGLAMLTLVSGGAIAIYSNFALPKKERKRAR